MELTKEYFDEKIGGMTTDISSLKSDMKEVKATLQRLDKRDKEDSNAFAKDIVELKKDVKILKLKQA
jgi:hypothetical protein